MVLVKYLAIKFNRREPKKVGWAVYKRHGRTIPKELGKLMSLDCLPKT